MLFNELLVQWQVARYCRWMAAIRKYCNVYFIIARQKPTEYKTCCIILRQLFHCCCSITSIEHQKWTVTRYPNMKNIPKIQSRLQNTSTFKKTTEGLITSNKSDYLGPLTYSTVKVSGGEEPPQHSSTITPRTSGQLATKPSVQSAPSQRTTAFSSSMEAMTIIKASNFT